MQDLLSAQELRLLRQTTKPLVLVGDTMQAISGFRDEPPCRERRRPYRCHLEPAPQLPHAIEWYGTYRLDSRTAGFLEERFGRPMISFRRLAVKTEEARIKWQSGPQFPHTLILCRQNTTILELIMQTPQCRVIGGRTLAARLESHMGADADGDDDEPESDAISNPSDRSFKRFVSRTAEADLRLLVQRLADTDLSLEDFHRQADYAVSTVHQCKGFECEHVALHRDLHESTDGDDAIGEEVNIRYVAFSRHTQSLTLLTERHFESDVATLDPELPPETLRRTTHGASYSCDDERWRDDMVRITTIEAPCEIAHLPQKRETEYQHAAGGASKILKTDAAAKAADVATKLVKACVRSVGDAFAEWTASARHLHFMEWLQQDMPIICTSTGTYMLSKPNVYRCLAVNPRQWALSGSSSTPELIAALEQAMTEARRKKIAFPKPYLQEYARSYLSEIVHSNRSSR